MKEQSYLPLFGEKDFSSKISQQDTRIHHIEENKAAWFKSDFCANCFIYCYTIDNVQWTMFACEISLTWPHLYKNIGRNIESQKAASFFCLLFGTVFVSTVHLWCLKMLGRQLTSFWTRANFLATSPSHGSPSAANSLDRRKRKMREKRQMGVCFSHLWRY